MSARPAIVFTALFLLLLPIYQYFDRPADKRAANVEEQQESLLKLNGIDSITVKRGSETLRYEKTADGKTVNRWLTTGMLAASASSNEVGYLTHKVIRSLGILSFDNQARV